MREVSTVNWARTINSILLFPGPRRYVGFAERRVVCAPSGREEMDSDEEIDEVDLPSVARNCFESARTVSRSPVQAPSLSGSHNDACSPNNESQLHELSAYLSPSPTITTADVESALRNANSESHLYLHLAWSISKKRGIVFRNESERPLNIEYYCTVWKKCEMHMSLL